MVKKPEKFTHRKFLRFKTFGKPVGLLLFPFDYYWPDYIFFKIPTIWSLQIQISSFRLISNRPGCTNYYADSG